MRNLVVALSALCGMASLAIAQIPRQDVIWGRTSTVPITVDGVLNEAAWAKAESVKVMFGQSAGLPGSGWHFEGTPAPSDPTNATIKFLVWGDSLYVAVIAKDSSVGGGPFNRKDGFLMNLRDKAPTGAPGVFINPLYSRSFEFFYVWWDADAATLAPGASPGFFGFVGGHRDSTQEARTDYPNVTGLKKRQIWDAVTTVQGMSNSDTASNGQKAYDQGYTTEMKFNVGLRGYNVSNPAGETIMYNISIYDGDWRWPIDTTKTTGNRVWLQSPFGNAAQLGHMNILVSPSVTSETTVLPALTGPDVVIRNGQNYATPVIDGLLNEEIWQHAPSINIEYGNDALRASYPNTGKYRSGQYQTPVDGNSASVVEASPATVKYFFKGDTLYLGFDVNDQVVSFRPAPDHRDGFRVTINDRAKMQNPANGAYFLARWDIRFYVDTVDHGAFRGRAGYLQNTLELDTLNTIQTALQLKPNSDLDTLEADPTTNPDQGYTAELAIDLTKIGYPAGRGDGVVFLGITHYDGDFFAPITNSYAVRTWWFRELNDLDGPAWMYMNAADFVTSVDDVAGVLPLTFELLGNYPNPFNPTTVVRYTMPEPGNVTLYVFDVLGRRVTSVDGGFQNSGTKQVEFNARGLSSGTYFYYLEMVGGSSNSILRTSSGKMLIIK
ncbi:MAG: T9SS type A sorting domain-containing protein [Ignavibacteriales bacterium]|nr:T9SS type A sorting domain-containing protein [Ignavibacteriales bacterium]